ncbi:hypothetical protein Ancab_037198, partial [Ancistrocladus abbreviatus]
QLGHSPQDAKDRNESLMRVVAFWMHLVFLLSNLAAGNATMNRVLSQSIWSMSR